MNLHTPKGAFTLGVGVPMDSQMFREQLQGSKPNGLRRFLYHWKAIETYMSKMGSHDPFGHLKHKLWPKEGPQVKLTIWLRPLKVRNRPNFLASRWRVTYLWKALDEGYNFSLDLILIGGLKTKLWRPKVTGAPTLAISRLPFGSLGTKCHLDVVRPSTKSAPTMH
jgi:hypothetical protein